VYVEVNKVTRLESEGKDIGAKQREVDFGNNQVINRSADMPVNSHLVTAGML
jgi:hypothetical protein